MCNASHMLDPTRVYFPAGISAYYALSIDSVKYVSRDGLLGEICAYTKLAAMKYRLDYKVFASVLN